MTAEILSVLSFFICAISIIFLLRFYGKEGLFIYTIVIVIASNIQVLKLTHYFFMENPVALGTVIFSTTFAVDNIITELFGASEARKNTFLSFFSYLIFIILMKITILYPTIIDTDCYNHYEEMKILFSTSLNIFISSLIAYIVGQLFDIKLFAFLLNIMKNKYLILRSFISMSLSTFLDNFVFSVLAWIILSDNPISWNSLWSTYIFSGYLLRLIVVVFCIPLVKLAKRFYLDKKYV